MTEILTPELVFGRYAVGVGTDTVTGAKRRTIWIEYYPLDSLNFNGVPQAAYGTRKLSSSYTGAAIRVRRASDATELDIGFTGAQLNTTILDAFISGTTGSITTWYDQSGNNNHATQAVVANQPGITAFTLRGTRVLKFDGATSKMTIPVGVATNPQAMTILIAGAPFIYIAAGSGLVELGNDTWFFENEDIHLGAGLVGSGQGNGLTFLALRGSPTATTFIRDDKTVTAAAATAGAKTGGTIGQLSGVGGFFLTGGLGAVIIYGRALSDTDLSGARDIIQTAYNIPPNTIKNFWATGDSIWAGSVNGWISPAGLAADSWNGGLRFFNLASGGLLIADATTRLTTFAAKIALGPGIVATNAGTNDIALTADSAATIWARLQTFCSTARGMGSKVIISTILPAVNVNYTAPRLAELAALNTLIRANWAANADGMIDYAANTIMGAAGAPNDTNLYLDSLHPTAYGASLLVPETIAAIQRLISVAT